MTSNNLTCQQYSLDKVSSAHAVFSAASHKCYKSNNNDSNKRKLLFV